MMGFLNNLKSNMMSSDFGRDMRNAMNAGQSEIVGIKGLKVQTSYNMVAQAVNSSDLRNLSSAEKNVLTGLTQQLANDGVFSKTDAQLVSSLVKDFASKGCQAFDGCWPFHGLDLGKLPGNPLFNGLAGILGDCLGRSMHDVAFTRTVDHLLDQVTPNVWSHALEGAFDRANLSMLNPSERSELTAMLSVAAADGKINSAEANVILQRLGQAGSSLDMGIPPMPSPINPFPGTPFPGTPFPGLPFPGLPGPVCPMPDWCLPKLPSDEMKIIQSGDGKASIDLGKYDLKINEHNSEFTLINKENGEQTRIWGDPHFDIGNDGKTDMDFWGTMSMKLEDGTKITINTTPWNGDPNQTLSSKLTITRGDEAIVVKGMDQNKIGDMSIEKSQNGRALDMFTGDGLTIYENPNKNGWQVQDGFRMRDVSQEDMNKTKNAASDFSLLEGLQALISSAASISLMSLLLNSFGQQNRP